MDIPPARKNFQNPYENFITYSLPLPFVSYPFKVSVQACRPPLLPTYVPLKYTQMLMKVLLRKARKIESIVY